MRVLSLDKGGTHGGKTGVSLVEHFEDLEDPRVERTKFHQLSDIIVIAVCAVICAADNWVEKEEFGHAKRDWLEAMLRLPNGIPSHVTFGRVFARLDAEQFEACSVKWVQHLHELMQGQLLAIDGKTVRRLLNILSQ
ncbi:MAG: ISAs1 family transposase [Caldilineaceae bacterium]|nr:ISAs1 family transposase [Caldilineaceae bacterium]